MQKILKNEKGSISLFILLAALFFLVVVTGVGVSLKNKESEIDFHFEKTKASYEKDVGNEEQIYNERIVENEEKDILIDVKLMANDNETEYSYENDTYTMAKQNGTAGYYVDAKYFEIGKKYRLTYKLQKIDGVLKNIGGHAKWADQILFKIDGKDVTESTYFISLNTNTVNIEDDNNPHLIEYEFDYLDKSKEDDNGNIYIQPNRSFKEYIKFKLFDVALYEIK